MQGASALQDALSRQPKPLTVFAVWEPVLKGDVAPTTETLAHLSDPRVTQLWDPEHLVSTAIAEGMRAHPGPLPLERQRTKTGILWDAVVVYAPRTTWDTTLPAPLWLDGDVDDVITGFEKILLPL